MTHIDENRRDSDSQSSDFKFNEFSTPPPYNPSGLTGEYSSQPQNNPLDYTGQSQFPQFNEPASIEDLNARIESAKSNGWGAQIGRFLGQNKKRVFVLAAIIALFAASSYLSGKGENSTDENKKPAGIAGFAENIAPVLDEITKDEEIGPAATPLDIKLDEGGQVIIDEKKTSVADETRLLAETGDAIFLTAQRGEGITHLARHAIYEYLKDAEKTLSAEQKIYAEDYIQNKTSSDPLDLGQTLSFSRELIKEAVEKAEGLTSPQIENLKQYTATVSLL